MSDSQSELKVKKALLVILIISFFNGKVFAENFVAKGSVNRGLDFREAICIALENNHEIKAMQKNLSATEKDIGIAKSYLMPRILLLEGFISTNDPVLFQALKVNQARFDLSDVASANHPGSIGNFLTSGLIFMPIFNKKTFVGIKMAKKQYSATGYAYLRKQEEVIKNVAQAYLAVGTTQEYIQIFIQSLEHAKDHLKTAEAHYKNTKEGVHPFVLESRTRVFEAEQKLNFAQKGLIVAKKGLALLLASPNPVEISTLTPPLEVREFDYYKAYSIHRSDISAMEINVENAKNKIKFEQAEWYPSLNAITAYNFWTNGYPFGATGNDYVTGVFLTWSPFDGTKRIHEVSKAKFKSQEAAEYLAGLRDLVNFKVFEAYSNTEDLQKRFELAKLAAKSATEAELLITEKWKKNLVPFVDILEAKAALDEANENLVKTSSDLRAQIISLYYEGGTIRNDLFFAYKNK